MVYISIVRLMAATPVNKRNSNVIFGAGIGYPPCEPAQEGPHALVMRHSGKKAPVQWFYKYRAAPRGDDSSHRQGQGH